MSSAKYQALHSDDYDEERAPAHRRYISEHRQLAQDPRFSPPPPPWWKRALLILFIVVMFWLYFSLRASMQKGAQSQITHANRCVRHSSASLFFGAPLWWGADRVILKILKTVQVPPSGKPRHF
jgi:hypothetical protein